MATSIDYDKEDFSELNCTSDTDDLINNSSLKISSKTQAMNETRRQLVSEFRQRLGDVIKVEHTDQCLLRWLKGNNFNLKRAEQYFRKNLFMREVYEIDVDNSDLWVKPEVAIKYGFHGYIGTDKQGSPIRYMGTGGADFIGFVKSMSIFSIGIYCSKIVDEDLKTIEKHRKVTGETVEGVTYIVDLEGMSLLQFAHKSVIETGLDLIRMLQDYYPNIWKVIILVNAPFFFDKVFNLFKPILRSSLLDKIRVKSKEYSAAELLKWIDADVLPVFLGGNKVDSNGDPYCSEFLGRGGHVPEKLYLMNQPVIQETDPDVKTMWVSARSVYNLMSVVKETGSKLHIRFRSETGGIGLCLLYKKFGSDPNNIEMPPVDKYLDENDESSGILGISPPATAQSHMAPVENAARCPWPGIYILRFDNTFSWINSKKIIYKVWAEPPSS